MRPLTIALVAGALLATGGVAVLAHKMIRGAAEEAAAKEAIKPREVEVLVAARDLPPGRILTEADLTWARWPESTARAAQVVVRQEGESTTDQMPGTATRRALFAGEPIAAAAVFRPGDGQGFMSQMIGPGKKAVGVTVSAASTASGFVLPGDLVDVILTVDLQKAEVTISDEGRFASQTIIRAVKVLAVDQALDASEGKPVKRRRSSREKAEKADAEKTAAGKDDIAIVGKTVALELTSAEAEKVLAAQAAGTLSLSLRSFAVDETKREGVTGLRPATGGGVRVIKGGEVAR
ncbi:MAG: Flp pilus assembly protein CpaB [Rhodospirillaceae bacterium]